MLPLAGERPPRLELIAALADERASVNDQVVIDP
jgi:hypothetical protein